MKDNVVEFKRKIDLIKIPRQLTRGGRPPYDGGMEARVARLESAIENILRDIADIKLDLRSLRDKVDNHLLILGGMIIALGLGLAGLMAKGFGWLS